MPIYEYRCVKCGERFEVFVRSFAQQSAPICPQCGSAEVRKALSLFSVGGTGRSSRSSAASCGSGPT